MSSSTSLPEAHLALQPHNCPSSHLFCVKCFNKLTVDQDQQVEDTEGQDSETCSVQCPNCPADIPSRIIRGVQILADIVDKLEKRCPNHHRGCTFTHGGKGADYAETVQTHLEQCAFQENPSGKCYKMVPNRQLIEHLESCEKNFNPCPNGCLKSQYPSDLLPAWTRIEPDQETSDPVVSVLKQHEKRHIGDHCAMRPEKCEACHEVMHFHEKSKHDQQLVHKVFVLEQAHKVQAEMLSTLEKKQLEFEEFKKSVSSIGDSQIPKRHTVKVLTMRNDRTPRRLLIPTQRIQESKARWALRDGQAVSSVESSSKKRKSPSFSKSNIAVEENQTNTQADQDHSSDEEMEDQEDDDENASEISEEGDSDKEDLYEPDESLSSSSSLESSSDDDEDDEDGNEQEGEDEDDCKSRSHHKKGATRKRLTVQSNPSRLPPKVLQDGNERFPLHEVTLSFNGEQFAVRHYLIRSGQEWLVTVSGLISALKKSGYWHVGKLIDFIEVKEDEFFGTICFKGLPNNPRIRNSTTMSLSTYRRLLQKPTLNDGKPKTKTSDHVRCWNQVRERLNEALASFIRSAGKINSSFTALAPSALTSQIPAARTSCLVSLGKDAAATPKAPESVNVEATEVKHEEDEDAESHFIPRKKVRTDAPACSIRHGSVPEPVVEEEDEEKDEAEETPAVGTSASSSQVPFTQPGLAFLDEDSSASDVADDPMDGAQERA